MSADETVQTATVEPVETPAQPPALREESELDVLARLGQWLALTESKDPDPRAQGAAGALRLYFARELELPPLAALELSVVRGRVVVSARLLRALAARQGLRVVTIERTGETCTVSLVSAAGEELGRTTFGIEDARRAGLIRPGSAWVTHPSAMLYARASARAIYDNAPETALGLVTSEEVVEPVSDAQHRLIAVLIRELEELDASKDWTAWSRETAGVRSRTELTKASAGALIEQLQAEVEARSQPTDREQDVAEDAEWTAVVAETDDDALLAAVRGDPGEERPT